MFSSNTSQVSGGYEIQRSLRFNRPDSTYLNRTPASAGNRQTWTLSFWIKKSVVNQLEGMFRAGDFLVYFNSDTLRVEDTAGVLRDTTQVFRDYSSWYHFVITLDTPNATANDRIKVYVNGSQITSFSILTNPTQNQSLSWNNNVGHNIGTFAPGTYVFGGYMTEVNFIDGQALTPSSFGAFDAQTGVWGPTPYAGSYGTNGFYLNFSDNSNTTAATLGKDYSGNGNNWTPNNFSVSAGAGNDSLVDVPTNWGTDTGVGGSVRGNYATLNPLDKSPSVTAASNGNLDVVLNTGATPDDTNIVATFALSSGKWYWECIWTADGAPIFGVWDTAASGPSRNRGTSNLYSYLSIGSKYNGGTITTYGASWTIGDVVGVALDMDAGTLTFYKNGASQGTAFSSLTGKTLVPAIFVSTGGTNAVIAANANFGQRPFAYTAPSGFKALNTQNLPTPTIGATTATQAGKYFNTVLYTGTNGTQSVSGVGFSPDFTWIKARSVAYVHDLFDTVRGAGRWLGSSQTNAEANFIAEFNSFDSNGFTVTQGGNIAANEIGYPYVAWNWKANGAGVTNTAGSITSTVSANTTSGFSVVTYTGNGFAGATVGHGLGAAPRMVIVKRRSSTADWTVYHASVGNTACLFLNLTNVPSTTSTAWNDTTPTASVVSLGTAAEVNGSTSTYVAYCFAEVPGYSRFGSYTGNGSSDGPFVFCGFRPAWVLIKQSSSSNDWGVFDVKRNTFNSANNVLYPNLSNAEGVFSAGGGIDILSNGFKARNATPSLVNTTGETYIFMAFAEAPQKFALAR